MAKKKPTTRSAPRRAAVAPSTINITQHIDARGVNELTLPRVREIVAKASEQTRADIVHLLQRGAFPKSVPAPPQAAARFWKVGADGKALPDTAKQWEGVFDTTTNLIWGRRLLEGERTWAESVKAASQATLCGSAARAPTIQERLSIVDYSSFEPALDVEFFDPTEKTAWEWTSTPASSPSDCAWGVDLGGGDSYRGGQSFRYRVRAVRAGQPLDFGL